MAEMSSAKKNAVTKTASRACKVTNPSNATMEASITSTRVMKNDSNSRFTKARAQKSSYRYASLSQNADDDDEEGDYDRFSNQSQSAVDDFKSDGEFSIAEDTDDEYTIGDNTKPKGAGNAKPNGKPKTKGGTRPDPNGRVKGRDLIPWTSKSSAARHFLSKLLIALTVQLTVARS